MHRVQVSEAAALLGTEGQLATAFVGAGLTERERMAVILVLGLDIPPGPSEWFADGRTQKAVARLMNVSAAGSSCEAGWRSWASGFMRGECVT